MSKDEEIRNIATRRRNILHLVHRYLLDNGLYGTAEALATEARLGGEYELCDNIDLDAMYLEYASYYRLKFGKYPKVLRQARQPPRPELEAKRKKTKAPAVATKAAAESTSTAATPADAGDLQVTAVKVPTHVRTEQDKQREEVEGPAAGESLLRLQEVQHGSGTGSGDQLLHSQEWQSLAELVRATILRDELKLSWADICGNVRPVEVIKEAVLLPLSSPELFAGGLKPWRSVLLHGPPGSGKTLLAKVLYAETRDRVTFFNVTASVIVSKWRGESEKILKILFHLAQRLSPAVIFLDEVEGLTSKRDRVSDHESSKRLKNELLQLLDGMEQSSGDVFVLATTNLPWEIDEAFLRRFEKKVLVQLPDATERALLIRKLLPAAVADKIADQQLGALVQLSAHFTGDEIRVACKEVAMQLVRRAARRPAAPAAEAKEVPLELAFRQIKPLSLALMAKHIDWQREYGS